MKRAADRFTNDPCPDATPSFLAAVYGRLVPVSVHKRETRVLARSTAAYSSRKMADIITTEFQNSAKPASTAVWGQFLNPAACRAEICTTRGPEPLVCWGGDWDRKEGTMMLESFLKLCAKGWPAHLAIVGRVPSELRRSLQDRPDVTMASFRDKNRPRQNERLSQLFARAHLLVV